MPILISKWYLNLEEIKLSNIYDIHLNDIFVSLKKNEIIGRYFSLFVLGITNVTVYVRFRRDIEAIVNNNLCKRD